MKTNKPKSEWELQKKIKFLVKDQLEKETFSGGKLYFDEIVKFSGKVAEEIIPLIRQERKQARQEGIEVAVKKLKMKMIEDTHEGLDLGNRWDAQTLMVREGWNQAVEELEAKISELKKKGINGKN